MSMRNGGGPWPCASARARVVTARPLQDSSAARTCRRFISMPPPPARSAPANERHAGDEQHGAEQAAGRCPVHRYVEPAKVIDDEAGRQLSDDDRGKERGHTQ